ncbi:hypothetical protein EI94DRAFT_1768528 [Lactarius quietus]|nr:hypothetical protein EI94DRAFT_1768528 [Lactarius quietus]
MTSLSRGLARTLRSHRCSGVFWVRYSSTSLQTLPRMLPSFSLQNKVGCIVCLVTGAAQGLGNEFCRAFIRSGCSSVALLDLKQSVADKAAEELVHFADSEASEDLKGDTPKVVGLECDVSSEACVEKAFTRTIETFGRVDVVVASANYSALDYPSDRIKRLYDVNAAKYMIPQGGGSIILVASMSATVVNIPQLQTPYNASKAAVKHMASSLSVEWAKKGVRVNSLSPGYMMTKLTRTVLSNNPELKGAIVFLASDASRFMTGSEIRIDGGYCCV